MIRKFYIDCGGWRGDSLEKYLNKDFKIFVFEPNFNFNHYYDNLTVELFNKAVWIYDGEIDFYIGTQYGGLGSTIFKDKTTSNIKTVKPIKVPCVDFSKWILNTFEINNYIILKINIEGAEYPILNKMIEDMSIKYINKLIVAFHYHKITSITKEEHNKLLEKLKGINIEVFGD